MRATIQLGGPGCALLCLVACADPKPPPEPVWNPGVVYPVAEKARRGLLDRRGLIHAHSVYSHDACDGMPEVDGVRDAVCFDDFRRGLCQAQHDFVMLTDHRDAFSATGYPDVLLHRPERGDTLVERGGAPTASWAACPDGRRALVLAGSEAATMPVGLERHVAPRDERSAIYGARTPEAISILKDNGAVVLLQHTEDWKVEDLISMPIDGFEMFNLHANSFLNLGEILELVLRVNAGEMDGLPHPDASVVRFISEDPRYLDRWSRVLASGARRVTTMGTDCHRNSFPAKLADGERIDSYRRMMIWLSNHLLVRPDADGTWDDRHLKQALREGRLYGVFDMLGYPDGFDFRASVGAAVHEIGADIPLADRPELIVQRPALFGIGPGDEQPLITLRLLVARDSGWQEVARADADELRHVPAKAGAYRAEVRIVPRHLRRHLADSAALADEDRVWIYANPIYVR